MTTPEHTPKYRVTLWDGTPLPEGEPYFVLRGQDVFAADVVQEYWLCLRNAGYSKEALAKVEEHMDEMRAWPTKKRPD